MVEENGPKIVAVDVRGAEVAGQTKVVPGFMRARLALWGEMGVKGPAAMKEANDRREERRPAGGREGESAGDLNDSLTISTNEKNCEKYAMCARLAPAESEHAR